MKKILLCVYIIISCTSCDVFHAGVFSMPLTLNGCDTLWIESIYEKIPIVASQSNYMYKQNETSCYMKFRFTDNHCTVYPDSFKAIIDTGDCTLQSSFEQNHSNYGYFRKVHSGHRIKPRGARGTMLKKEIMYILLHFRFSNKWDGKIVIPPNKSILCDSIPILIDTLKITVKKDSLRFPLKEERISFGTRKPIKWSEVYNDQVMQTFDKPLVREKIKQWLLTIDEEDTLPDGIAALNFTLRQSPDGYYTIDLVGSTHDDADNDDWTRRTDFVPKQKSCLTLKIATTVPAEEVLKGMTKVVKSVARELKKMPLLQVEHIVMRGVEGNVNAIK